MVLKMLNLKPKDIGFVKSDVSGIGKGLLLGLCCFAISYLLEMGILFLNGKEPSLAFCATGFLLNSGEIKRTALGFILLCVFFNVINVIATNLVHVITENEADSMQIVRIIIAQLLSLLIVIFAYKKYMKVESES